MRWHSRGKVPAANAPDGAVSWESVLREAAGAWGRPVSKKFVGWGRHLVVPPDDVIRIEVSTLRSQGVVVPNLSSQVVLRAQLPTPWRARVHIVDREPPGQVAVVGSDPVVIDDPAVPWVVQSTDRGVAGCVADASMVAALLAVWAPTSWCDIARHGGGTRVILGEQRTTASLARLQQLVDTMRTAIAQVNSCSRKV